MKQIIGDPQPVTYLPFRNLLLLTIAAGYAEVNGFDNVFCGLQMADVYGYWDTTAKFVESVNDVFIQNRKNTIQVSAPFNNIGKADEINFLLELDGNVNLLKHTLTCYDPDEDGKSCGICASCTERIRAFAMVGVEDPISYSIEIDWDKLFQKLRVK